MMRYISGQATLVSLFVLLVMNPCHGDLIAHFPLDEDGDDVASGFEGFVPDSVSFSDEGLFGGAAEFEGFEGIQVEYDEALNPEDAFTVTAWVNPFDTTSWNSVITSRSHAGEVISGYIIYNTPENQWDFWTGGGGAPGSWGRNIGPEAEIDEWVHLAITYDGDEDTKTLYVNGEEEAVVSGQGYEPNPNNPLTIGAGGDLGAEFFFVGLIDDLSLWDETLEPEAIQSIMEDGVAAFVDGGGGILGDFNGDGDLDATDINALTNEILTGGAGEAFDVNKDSQVNDQDRTFWVEDLKNTWFGDADLNGEFNTSDLVSLFQAGQFEDAVPSNSTWETGDFDGDGDFGTSDLVSAFQGGGFEKGPRNAVAAVPEPTGLTALFSCILTIFVARRKRIV